MLKCTADLLAYLHPHNPDRNVPTLISMVNCVMKLGARKDAEMLLDQYLQHMSDFDHQYLLRVFKKFGDNRFAEIIYNSVITDNKLNESANPKILEVLGHLKYEPVKQLLFDYGFSAESSYYLHRSAVLALLNYDCSAYKDQIEKAVADCMGKNLFPEFIPALVSKLPNKGLYLEQLFELGSEFASTDCNAGILLGFALSGEEGKPYFHKALFDPNWETYATGTGTVYFVYQGLKLLGISFNELYEHVILATDNKALAYHLWVLFALFDQRLQDYDDENIDSFKSLYNNFYQTKLPHHFPNLAHLAAKVQLEDEATTFEKSFETRMTEEMIVQSCTS